MTRDQLEHVLRAAGAIAGVDSLIVIGSQAILGYDPSPPDELLVSMTVDLYPPDEPGKADLIDGSIGEDSPFHETFGYYAHGVGPETAVLPRGWRSRLVELNNERTNSVAGLCLHPVDIAIAKLAAGREKDLSYVRTLVRSGIVGMEDIRSALKDTDEPAASAIGHRLEGL